MLGILKNHLIFLSLMLGAVLLGPQSLEIKRVDNNLKEIQDREGQLRLVLIREWGGENEEDANKMFYEPRDLSIDSAGLIYILEGDSISVFDSKGKFLRQIGRPGQGPGEFLDAYYITIDKQNNLMVSEGGNRRIQIIDSGGRYLGSFSMNENFPGSTAITKNKEILTLNRKLTKESSSLWIFYNYEGRVLRERGERKSGSSAMETLIRDNIDFSLDDTDCIYAASICSPHFQKYSASAELQMEVRYDVPYEVPKVEEVRTFQGIYVQSEVVCKGIALDGQGRVYLLTLARLKNEEERKIGVITSLSSRNGNISQKSTSKANLESDKTDLYQILVFSNTGKIIGSKKIDFYANRIKIFNSKLFLIDSYINMKIYEYKILPE